MTKADFNNIKKGGNRTFNGPFRKRLENAPLISIITIVFNGEKYLERAIKSVISQSYPNIEYIIIDGNSSDRSLEIIRNYKEKIDFWISEPDDGISDGFNKGFSYSSGDYIAYLNSDDWYEPEAVAGMAAELNDQKTIYCGHMNLWSADGLVFSKLHKSRPDRLLQTMRIAHPASFVPKDVFGRVGGFSGAYRVAMDYDFMIKAMLAGFRFKVIDKLVANHQKGGNSHYLPDVYRDELNVKNNNLGKRPAHYFWYILNIAYFKITNLFNQSGK
jgi:glycosyltransferase involved in cell wall biosynthesis